MAILERAQLTCGVCAYIDTPNCYYSGMGPKRLPSDDDAIGCPNLHLNNRGNNNFTPASAYFGSNGKFIPKRLGDELLKEYNFLTMIDNKDLYVYDVGIYIPNGETIVREQVRSKLGERAKSHYVQEVIDHIKDLTPAQRSSFNNDVNLICLENSIYNLETGKIQPHISKIRFLQKHPIVFDPDAECPNIDRFLEEILPNSDDREAVLQFIGYCLYRSYPIQRAFLLVGSGSNGKSTLQNIIIEFLGRENVTSTSLQELETNRFAVARLFGKNANIFSDLPSTALQSTSKFKALTGGDLLTGEFKFKKDFNFKNHAKLIFSTNKIPKTNDDSNAFFRRWAIIIFTQKFEGKNKDPYLIKKLTTEAELSGLFNKAMPALKRLLIEGEFANAKSVAETKEYYIRHSDPIQAYVYDCLEIDLEKHVTKNELYNDFVGYCKEHGYVAPDQRVFHKSLPDKVAVVSFQPNRNGERPRCWKGIRITRNTWNAKNSQFPILTNYTINKNNKNMETTVPDVPNVPKLLTCDRSKPESNPDPSKLLDKTYYSSKRCP